MVKLTNALILKFRGGGLDKTIIKYRRQETKEIVGRGIQHNMFAPFCSFGTKERKGRCGGEPRDQENQITDVWQSEIKLTITHI